MSIRRFQAPAASALLIFALTGGCGDDTGGIDDDRDGELPYGACPSGDDGECLAGETCVLGTQGGIDWSACTAGTCNDDSECDVTPDDSCTDLPGDGELLPYCIPMTCTLNDPCPSDMFCAQGFGTIGNVCVWPN